MTLCADPELLLHRLRINYLRYVQDRAADRVFEFPSDTVLLRNPFIRASDDPFTEMQVCYSPELSNILGQRMSSEPNPTRKGAMRFKSNQHNNNQHGDPQHPIRMASLSGLTRRGGTISVHTKQPAPIDEFATDQDEMDIEKTIHRTLPKEEQSVQPSRTLTNDHPLPISKLAPVPETNTPPENEDTDTQEEEKDHSTEPIQSPKSFQPKKSSKSALTAMINKRLSAMNNPLAAEYGSVAGTNDNNAIRLKIWLPHSDNADVPMEICVRGDASVEEVVGYTLYQYIDQKRQPPLDGLLSVIYWNMRIVEEDGEIDEDLPALERGRQIQKFSFAEFALCKATASQIEANERARRIHKSSKTELRPPRSNSSAMIRHTVDPSLGIPTAYKKLGQSTLTNKASTQSLQQSTTPMEPMREIRVHIHNTLSGYCTGTMTMPLSTLFSEILIQICRKWKVEQGEYVLKFQDTKKDVPLDQTLEQYPDLKELVLMKKNSRASGEFAFSTPVDHRISKAQPKFNITNGLPHAYQRFTVTRRMPMLVGRHERILAIDGEYIHVMPSENRTMFDNTKTTSSYHISSVLSCKQHRKVRSKFKLVVYRDRDIKTYDFDGANEDETTEICARIEFLKRLSRNDNKGKTATGGKATNTSHIVNAVPPPHGDTTFDPWY